MAKRKLRGLVLNWFDPVTNVLDGTIYKLLKNSEFDYDIWAGGNINYDFYAKGKKSLDFAEFGINILRSQNPEPTSWVNEAMSYFDEHGAEYDFILSFSMPVECHEAALKIKQKHPEIKWLAAFGELASLYPEVFDVNNSIGLAKAASSPDISGDLSKADNPFLLAEYAKREDLSSLHMLKVAISPVRLAKKFLWNKGYQFQAGRRDRFRSICQATFASADKIFYTDDYQKARLIKAAGGDIDESKLCLVPPAYDRSLFKGLTAKSESTTKTPGKLEFVYVGFLDETTKRAGSLLAALGELKEQDAELADKLHVTFYGGMQEPDLAEIVKYDVSDLVTMKIGSDYHESLVEIAHADWTIVIDENVSRKSDTCQDFPVVLMDYLGGQKKVLAITQYSGITADIVHDTGCGIVVTHSASELALYLSRILYQAYDPVDYHQSALKVYEAAKVATKFDQTISQLC